MLFSNRKTSLSPASFASLKIEDDPPSSQESGGSRVRIERPNEKWDLKIGIMLIGRGFRGCCQLPHNTECSYNQLARQLQNQ